MPLSYSQFPFVYMPPNINAQSGKIKGEFAKIASKVDEMDNHVVVLVKLK